MRSTHTYTAVLIGAPNLPLDVRGGSVALDSSRAPHVQMTLTVAAPDESTLIALDPRLNKRIQVVAAATFPTFSQSRTFNLHLREARQPVEDATVDLTLASDEAMLDDYAPLADDTSLYALQGSLRAVVNAVLAKVIPGAALASSPAGDADATTYSDATNLAPNPRGSVNLTGWQATGTTVIQRSTADGPPFGTAVTCTWTAAAGTPVILEHIGIPVVPGRAYTFAESVKANFTRSDSWLEVAFIASNGAQISAVKQPQGVNGGYQRPTITAVAPVSATEARVRFAIPTIAVNNLLVVSGVMVRERPLDPGDTSYWDGDTLDTATYRYDWANNPGGSASTRTALVVRPAAALYWQAGTSALDLLAPLVQASGFRLVCDESRVWTLRGASYVAPGNVTVVHGVDMVTAEGVLAREGEWFDGQVTRYTTEDPYGITRVGVDAWALTATPTRVNLVEIDAPYPGPGRSQYAVKRAQGRGRTVSATKVADWTVRAEQGTSIYMTGAPTQTGLVDSVTYDLSNDEMTITTRTADTNLGSIDLLSGVIDALVGVIDAL